MEIIGSKVGCATAVVASFMGCSGLPVGPAVDPRPAADRSRDTIRWTCVGYSGLRLVAAAAGGWNLTWKVRTAVGEVVATGTGPALQVDLRAYVGEDLTAELRNAADGTVLDSTTVRLDPPFRIASVGTTRNPPRLALQNDTVAVTTDAPYPAGTSCSVAVPGEDPVEVVVVPSLPAGSSFAFTLPAVFGGTSRVAMLDVVLRAPGGCPEVRADRSLAYVRNLGQAVMSRASVSTLGGNRVEFFGLGNGGTCDLRLIKGVRFGTAGDAAVSTTNPNHLVVSAPASEFETTESVEFLDGSGGASTTCSVADSNLEFVQWGFTVDAADAEMRLFRTSPAFDEARHDLGGRPFPSVPLEAVSDVDVVTSAGGFLRSLLVVEEGREVRQWNVAAEEFQGSYPGLPGCPPQSWSPWRVTVDPTGELAWVLSRNGLGSPCEGGAGPTGPPIVAVDLMAKSLNKPLARLDGENETVLELAGPMFTSGETQAVDAMAQVERIGGSGCPGEFAFATEDHWRNAGRSVAGEWERRFLIVTQAGPAFAPGGGCMLDPPGCTTLGQLYPPGCSPLIDPRCRPCRRTGSDCHLVRRPLHVVVYDVNPSRAEACDGRGVKVISKNPFFLHPRAAIELDPHFPGPDIELGLDVASSADGDDLYVVAPLSDRVLKLPLADLLDLGRNIWLGDVPVPLTELPATKLIADLSTLYPGARPTDVTIMKDTLGDEFAYVTLGGRDQVLRRATAGFTDSSDDRFGEIDVPAGSANPLALAGRDQGDAVFTANFDDGSVSNVLADPRVRGALTTPIGFYTGRLAIQPAASSGRSAELASSLLRTAPVESFDTAGHQVALVELSRHLEQTIVRESPVPAVEAAAGIIGQRVLAWVVDADLALAVKREVETAASLYRQSESSR